MPAAKPTFNAALDTSNPLTTGLGIASWCVTDPAYPTRLTEVASGKHGTLHDMTPGYNAVATGGTGGLAAYNQTYAWNSATLWVGVTDATKCIADNMGKGFVLMPTGGDPMMDSVSSTWGALPWSSTWSPAITVAQGSLAAGPWVTDGVLFPNGGYVDFGNVGNGLEPGTSDFSVVIDYTWLGTTSGPVDTLMSWSVEAGSTNPLMIIRRWAGGGGWADPVFNIDLRVGGVNGGASFANSFDAWEHGVRKVVALTFHRSGNMRLYINGTYISQADISPQSGSMTGMASMVLGHCNYATGWNYKGSINTFLVWPARLLSDAEVTAVSRDIYALAVGAAPPTSRKTVGGLAVASVKTVKGLAAASVKTVDGLA